MENLELFGVLLVILGLVGFVIMLKGKRPSHGSSAKSLNQGANQIEK